MTHNRRTQKKLPSWAGWVGHMSTPREFLLEKNWNSGWGLVKAANSFFRSIGLVAFANNPLTGILIFLAMCIGNTEVAMATILCWSIAALTSKMLNVSERQFCDGLPMFNSILVGCVLTAVIPGVFEEPMNKEIWILIAFGAAITVFVDQGLNAMMAPSKLPGQSVPFNIVAVLLFLTLKNKHMDAALHLQLEPMDMNVTESIDWSKAWQGVLLSTGQIYGVGTPTSSVFIWLGFLICSPILTFLFACGAVIGTFMGAYLVPGAVGDVYLGLFGYNCLLAAGGLIFFVVPSARSIACALVCSVLASLVQIALLPIFGMHLVPVLSYPFNVAIMLMLSLCFTKDSPLQFVGAPLFTEPTCPEFHLHTSSQAHQEQVQSGIDLDAEASLADNQKL